MVDFNGIIEKYYSKGSPLYDILTIHGWQVAAKALKIAHRCPELQLDVEFIEEAAMLHDIGIFLCHAPKIHCFGNAQYIEHGYLGADILRKEGLPRHALVAERHTGTGITLEQIVQNNLPLPHYPMEPESLEEQVISYADKFYSKSKLNIEHSVEEIRAELLKYGKDRMEKFDEWHTAFG